MSKMKQIAALTAMLVVVIMYASPAKSAVCFLPDDDGSCGGGDIEISDDSTSENQCADFNLSQNQRNSKEYDSDCYTCEPCTYNGRTTYKCALNSGATWYGGNLSVCCTGGEKYFSKQGQCCPTTGCACSGGHVWNPSTEQCECPNGIETTTGICCNDGEHADGAICCPEKKHNDGGVCKCDSQYNTDDDGNCVLQNEQKITIVIYYKMDSSRQNSSSWLDLTFKVLSSSDTKSHSVELTFNPVGGATPTNCTINYPLTFGTNTKTKVQCGSVYSMMNTPELTNVSVDNSNVAASVRLNQLDNSTVQNDKYVIKFTRNYNQTCEELGYVTSCNSCELAYTTGYIDSNDEECYRCEPYDCTKKCSEMNPLWVGENTGCGKPTGGVGSFFEMNVVEDEAGEIISGSDGDCNICTEKRGFWISTKSSKCYKFVSITGDGVERRSNSEYYVPYGTEITVTTQNNDPNSRYCGNAYDDLKVNNSGTYSRRNRTFKIDEDFISKNRIKSNSFDMAIIDDVSKITYTAKVEFNVHSRSVHRSDYEYNNPKCYAESAVDIIVEVNDISNDEFMDPKNTTLDVFIDYLSPDKVAEYLPSGRVDINGKRQYITYCNTVDDSGGNGMPILTKRSRFDLYFKNETITLKYDGNMDKCVQLGTEEDNTEFCYDIEFSDYDLSSDVVSDCPPHPEYYCPLYGKICNGYRCDEKPI